MIEPLKYRVIIKPQEVKETTKGGILLPEQAVKNERMATQIGIVVAIGAEADVGKAVLGSKVLFAKYGGRYIKEPETGEDVVILNDEDILAVYPEDEVEDNG